MTGLLQAHLKLEKQQSGENMPTCACNRLREKNDGKSQITPSSRFTSL
jgi:hypothetical protein